MTTKITVGQNRLLHAVAAKIWSEGAHENLSDFACEMFGVDSFGDLTKAQAYDLIEILRQQLIQDQASPAQLRAIRNWTKSLFDGDYKRLAGFLERQVGKRTTFDLTKKEATKVLTGFKQLRKEQVI
jgi:hypothetical protein